MKFTNPLTRETDYYITNRPLIVRMNGEGVSLHLSGKRLDSHVTIAWDALYHYLAAHGRKKMPPEPTTAPSAPPIPEPFTTCYHHITRAMLHLGKALEVMEKTGNTYGADYSLIEAAMTDLRAVDREGV